MPFATYTDLQAEVADWLDRKDLGGRIPSFIRLAEVRIARRLRTITVKATVALTGRDTVLPPGCAQLRSIRVLGTTPYPMTVATLDGLALYESRYGTGAGQPRLATVLNGVLTVVPTPVSPLSVEITYFDTLIPLGGLIEANSVLTTAPDLYLFGALKEASRYLQHDDRVATWDMEYEKAFDELEIARDRMENGATFETPQLPVVF